MEYDDAAAERLEAVYLGPDVVAQREDTLKRLAVESGERILDIGSGPGFLAEALADRTGPNGEVIGVDISEQMITRAYPHATLAHGSPMRKLTQPRCHLTMTVSMLS